MSSTPGERRKAKNEAHILDVARKLILAKGFENVSLRAIAKQADYSPAALYKYFDNKADIMRAVLRRENGRLIAHLDKVDRALAPESYLVSLCMAYVGFNLQHPVYSTLLNNLGSGRNTPDDPIPASSPFRVILRAVAQWTAAEAIRLPENYGVEEVTYALWAQMHGMASLQLKQLQGYPADFEATDRTTLETYLSGLRTYK